MKPEIALKLQYSLLDKYTREQIETIRDEWIAAYREIAGSNSSKKGVCESFTDRINRAADLFIRRKIEPVVSDAISHDDYYYEWLDEMKKEEDDSLDGDFPLGNEADMKLASSFFSIKELALLQTGLAEQIDPEPVEPDCGFGRAKTEKNYARKGFLAELKGRCEEAVEYYSEHCDHSRYPDDYVRMRLEAIKDKLAFESNSKLLLERAAEYKEKETSIRFLRLEFHPYGFIHRVAETEEEKAVVKKCGEQILDCYQRELERNYKRIEAYKKCGATEFTAVDSWTLTLDENGKFVRASVVGIDEKGDPIYSGNCTAVDVSVEKSLIIDSRDELKEKLKEFELTPSEQKAWFDDAPDLYELQVAAQSLKQRGLLYGDDNPTLNYDLDGLVGGQLDAAAWQNYAIENGLVRPHVNYDETLDRLIDRLQRFIELYEKALSIV